MSRGEPSHRWHANVCYRTVTGLVVVEHDFEELEELHDLIERGPDWNAIQRIHIYLARSTGEVILDLRDGGAG